MKNTWSLKLSKAVLLFSVFPFFVSAQFSKPVEKFPKDEKYLYPVYPGRQGSLAGTMGELRSTHFHGGIDIRTNNMIGMPVLSSKSGFISRITMTTSGYGNVIYIKHDDGNTTVYGHLDVFKGPHAEYILSEQYRRRTSEIDLYFRDDQFMLQQGDTIGLSGNSGGSGGPHLHFEIRDSNNYTLDPIIVGNFPELADNLPPRTERIALRTLDANARINDRFGRFEFYAQRVGNNYIIANPILARGNIGVEILAKDNLALKSPFFGGVNYLEMRVDSALVFRQAIEKINIAETRSILTVMDFKTMRNKDSKFYKLYVDEGNALAFYNTSPTTGKINVRQDKDSKVQVKLKDSNGNTSTLSFRFRPNPPVKQVNNLEVFTSNITYTIHENIMMVTTKPCKTSNNKINLYSKGVVSEIEPDYFNYNRSVYLIDLRKMIPDSISICGKSTVTNFNIPIPSRTGYDYYSDLIEIQFPMNSLYDTLYLSTKHDVQKTNTEYFTIGSPDVPLNKSIMISLKPTLSYSKEKNTAVYRVSGRNGFAYCGGEWKNDRIQFYTRDFGGFTILSDTIPPTIRPIYVNQQSARFKIQDNLSGIKSFEAKVNGEWILMHYDYKINTIWSERLDKSILMKGDFELLVTDNAGNKAIYTQKIF
ncbi:MAG TPA: M23 family metallopeptidase [Chryseolinea sp.]|nr:M23 family metallopeptidase [Chryseolinea sp.]HPM31871.1 M23 family metallopeptidase [Chryseolinea sp.]